MDDDLSTLRKLKTTEVTHILLISIVAGVVINFRDWVVNQRVVEVDYLLSSALVVIITAFAILILRTLAQKWVAYKRGYYSTFTFHKWGLPLSIFLTFFLNGGLPYLSPGEVHIQESKRLRLGAHRYGLSFKDLALVGLAGPAVCVLSMILIKPIALAMPSPLLDKLLITVAAITISGMVLPLRGTEGFHVLYYRRGLWVFVTAFLIAYFILIIAANVFSYVVAAVFAIMALWFYRNHIES